MPTQKFLLVPTLTSYYSSLSGTKTKGSELSTVEGYAIKSWLETNGNQADILFNDVGYTPHILNTEYDVLILKAPGFVFFGGEIDKRISQFLEFLAGWKDRKVKLWVINNLFVSMIKTMFNI
jgi:hypothetical protein